MVAFFAIFVKPDTTEKTNILQRVVIGDCPHESNLTRAITQYMGGLDSLIRARRLPVNQPKRPKFVATVVPSVAHCALLQIISWGVSCIHLNGMARFKKLLNGDFRPESGGFGMCRTARGEIAISRYGGAIRWPVQCSNTLFPGGILLPFQRIGAL